MDKAKYIGYIWYSNTSTPDIYDGSQTLDKSLFDLENRFIIEGQLYSPDLSKSVSIKFVDGQYIEKVYDVTDDDFKNATSYESNRIEGKRLRFTQRWVSKADEYCDGMSVLVPAEIVFLGFDN